MRYMIEAQRIWMSR